MMMATSDKAEQLLAGLNAVQNPTVNTLSLTSGTAAQDASGQPSNVYVAITPHASGTVAVAIGPSNAVADAIIPAGDASLAQTVNFRLPANWWFKVTVGGSAAIASAVQVVGG